MVWSAIMKAKLLVLALLAAGVAGPTSSLLAADAATSTARVAVNTPDPAQQIQEVARLFRAGDVAGLARVMVPPSKWAQAQTAYELQRLEPISDEDRAEFEENIARFTAPDAVDTLMAEFEPKLEEARPQAAGALLMAFGAMQMAVNSPESKLTEDQRLVLQAALPGIQQWASTTDFLSSTTLRDALTLLTEAARRTGIDSLDQLKALPLEGVLDRARPVLAAAKDAVQLYGIDLDAVVDSLQVDVLENDGQTARVRTTVTLFGAPVWHEHELVLVEGRWYGKHAALAFDHHHDNDDQDEESSES
jgi:hypothetical protein